MTAIIDNIRKQLRQNSDAKTKASGERFFKEKIVLYGVKSAIVGRIAKESFKEIKGCSKKEIFDLCEELWKSGYIEETFVACSFAYHLCKQFEPSDINVFERWIDKYISNWASCDTFCNHTVGDYIVMYPQFLKDLKRWAVSNNRWMRRASAVSLIVPAKRGMFLKEVFEISDILLLDSEDMVQKGYGWLLKVASNNHQKEVFNYVMKNKSVMPRTALRYAIEKMPKDLKKNAMEK